MTEQTLEHIQIAKDPNTSVEDLVILSQNEDAMVRAKVANHPKTPTGILDNLSQDEISFVRYQVFTNPNTSVETKGTLSIDDKVQGHVKDDELIEELDNILVDMGLMERSIDEFGSPQTTVMSSIDIDLLSKFRLEWVNERFKNFGEKLDGAMNTSKS